MQNNQLQCPKCAHLNDAANEECEHCGITFTLYWAQHPESAPVSQPDPDNPDTQASDAEDVLLCPKCKHPNPYDQDECLACGIVFTKYFRKREEQAYTDQERVHVGQKERNFFERQEKLRQSRLEIERQQKMRRDEQVRERLIAEAKRQEEERQRQLEEARLREEEQRARLEALRLEQEEKARQEALERQRQEEERQRQLEEARLREEEHRAQLETLRIQQEQRQRLLEEARRREEEEHAQLETLRIQQEQRQRLLEETRLREEEQRARLEALRLEQEEKARQEALERQRQEEERQRQLEEASRRAEEERARLDALRLEQEERQRQLEEARRVEEQDLARLDALRLQQQELQRQFEAAKRREEEERARLDALRLEQEERARQEIERKRQEEENLRLTAAAKRLELVQREPLLEKIQARAGMEALLREHLWHTIGINSSVPNLLKAAQLVAVGSDYFSVWSEEFGLVNTYPFHSILTVIEGVGAHSLSMLGAAEAYGVIIQVVPAPSLIRSKKTPVKEG